jgi:hypothetical protein
MEPTNKVSYVVGDLVFWYGIILALQTFPH